MSSDASSGDDETQEQNRVSKYKCPADFLPFSYDPSGGALLDRKKEKELWLIKAPAHFDPKCFTDLKVPLSGLQMVQSGGTSQIYSVLSSRMAPSDLHLLIADGENKTPSLCASHFNGVLNISESYGNCSENQSPVPIPTAPAPCIPPGLKQRFHPYGSSVPAHIEEQVTMVSPTAPKRTRLDPDVGEERRKKKKKKKDKRDDREANEDVSIKQEQIKVEVDQIQSSEDVPTEERRRKKKKVKKEKERCEETINPNLISNTEPLDSSYVDTDTPRKSKKKKKSRNE